MAVTLVTYAIAKIGQIYFQKMNFSVSFEFKKVLRRISFFGQKSDQFGVSIIVAREKRNISKRPL